MFSLARTAAPNASRLLRRSIPARTFAQVVPAAEQTTPAEVQTQSPNKASTYSTGKGKVPVREDHGLYAFFRQKPKTEGLRGEDKYITLETPEMQEHLTGRDWKASELRLKSFRDLHTLWYVLVRERNLLATQRAEARRNGIDRDNQSSKQKQYCVRISMARIKAVLNERRLAYESLREESERYQQFNEDMKVQEYLERELDSLRALTKATEAEASISATEAEEAPEVATSEPTPIAEQSEVVHETVQQKA